MFYLKFYVYIVFALALAASKFGQLAEAGELRHKHAGYVVLAVWAVMFCCDAVTQYCFFSAF